MSAVQDDELVPSTTEGYKVGQSKTVAELADLDKEDESLQRWKASLGLAGAQGGPAEGKASLSNPSKQVVPQTLFLESPTLKKPLVLDLTQGATALATRFKKNPLVIKEGVDYSVGITFSVEGQIVSGLKYLQVVKRAGLSLDKMEAMIGSYGPARDPYQKIFAAEESPSGMLARSGSYDVRSRIIDDDNKTWLDFEWSFKIAKEWAA
ncbi:putative Rho GDP-dissociation inhibitor 1 [Filobasidium floriforme]|uniref:putative Rho GDP-dissociation inhibitor 1 n=1 Tax=Filobasidium floriforme TaxID=5210 RepID=UPI001E8E4526|nr:putative Rho GDP-dissociation inhibitor 1 [Filobasidium floriforme]KAH8080515.1 putative Rho GDP-dissociation inhibitor 1 [Filobasidium floriforme]